MDMRGLAHFIQDVRKATSNPLEEKERVNFELAKIRSKFRDTAVMSTYNRKKYVCKLMFIAMLGYPVEFGHMEGVKLLALTTPAEKLIGYLFVTVFLNENHPLLTLTTHMIYKDLLSGEALNVSLALTAVANAGGKDFAEVMSESVKNIILNDACDVHLRKKAVLTYLRVYRKYPEVVDLRTIVPVVTDFILSHQFGLCGCAVAFLTGCFSNENLHYFHSVPQRVIELLGKIILAKQTEPGYVYYGVPAPWLQAMAIRLLRKFPPPTEIQLRDKALHVLRKIVEATDRVLRDALTQQKQKGTMNRVSSMNAVLVEIVALVMMWDIDKKFRTECLDVINGFIIEKKDANLRYLGFSLLSKMCSLNVMDAEYQAHFRQYQPQIIVALHDPDVSIRTKALDVTIGLCNSDNAKEVIVELLSYLTIFDGAFKESLVFAIAKLAETYCTDYGWYVDTIVSVIVQAGSLTPRAIADGIIHVVVNNPQIQKRAVTSLFNALKSHKNASEVLVRIVAFTLGEFGYQIALNVESTPRDQINVLQRHLNDVSDETQCVVLSALTKFYNYYDTAARESIVKIIRLYRHSFNAEIQQRCMEYLGLIEMGNDELLQRVLEPLPPFDTDSFAIRLGDSEKKTEKRSLTPVPSVQASVSATIGASGGGDHCLSKPVDLQVHSLPTKLSNGIVNDAEMIALFHLTSSDQVDALKAGSEIIRNLLVPLLTKTEGFLYMDQNVELYCEQQYRGADARLTVTVRNKSNLGLQGVQLDIIEVDVELMLQCRNNGGDIAPGKEMKVEFAARSLAPYQQMPTIRFCYLRESDSTHVMKILSLPIATTKFLSPYAEHSELAYDSVYTDLINTSAIVRRLATCSSLERNFVDEVIRGIGFCLINTSNTNEWKAIAAHATHPHDVVLYSAVLMIITVSLAGETTVKVLAKNPVLQSGVLNVLEQTLLYKSNEVNQVINTFF